MKKLIMMMTIAAALAVHAETTTVEVLPLRGGPKEHITLDMRTLAAPYYSMSLTERVRVYKAFVLKDSSEETINKLEELFNDEWSIANTLELYNYNILILTRVESK